jgi:hypothetical protein
LAGLGQRIGSSGRLRSKGDGMTVIAEDQLVFENEEWLVTESGLEHKRTGYFIERGSLGHRRSDGLWSWPLHMPEKQWCTPAPFTEAFTCAAAVYDIEVDADLAQSFKAARCEIVGWPKTSADRAPEPAGTHAGALREQARAPISREAPRADRPWWEEARGEESADPGIAPQIKRERAGRARGKTGPVRGGAGWHWRAPRPIRRASTRLVRLLQAALYAR